jgi:alkylation response protein AidB-like acyl-CoA dehydrogenase
MMPFDLTPEQKQLKDTARRFAADEIIPVAAKYDDEQTFADEVVRKAWELGLIVTPDLRRHQPDPARRDSAESPEGLIRLSELTIPP